MSADHGEGIRRQHPIRMLGRAALISCPQCGTRGLFESWFRLRTRCPGCGLPLERGEQHDYWIGGMMFNIALAELVAVVAIGGAIVATWPDVPWNGIWIGGIVLMLVTPFLLFPMSRLLWLAFDLIFRPGHESHRR
jgi:uncharacterized protein (DUF983 family)